MSFNNVEFAFWYIDESTLILSSSEGIHHYLSRNKPLVPRELAANDPMSILNGSPAMSLGIRGELFRKLEKELPPAYQPLARADSLTLTLDLKGEGNIALRVDYGSDRGRAAAEAAVEQLVQMGKSALIQQRKQMSPGVFTPGYYVPAPLGLTARSSQTKGTPHARWPSMSVSPKGAGT